MENSSKNLRQDEFLEIHRVTTVDDETNVFHYMIGTLIKRQKKQQASIEELKEKEMLQQDRINELKMQMNSLELKV